VWNKRQFLGSEHTRTRTESNYVTIKLRFAIKCPPNNREDLGSKKTEVLQSNNKPNSMETTNS
jgi:hypothetical protein